MAPTPSTDAPSPGTASLQRNSPSSSTSPFFSLLRRLCRNTKVSYTCDVTQSSPIITSANQNEDSLPLYLTVRCSSGGTSGTSESSHLQESSVHYNIPELQSTPGRPPQTHSQTYSNAHSFPHPLSQTHPQSNGQHASVAPHREVSGTRENLSGPDDSEEEEEDEEEEAPPPRWQGIESIFEAYQEYIEGKKLQLKLK